MGDEVTVKKASLLGLASFVQRVDQLSIEPVRGAMQLAGILINDTELSLEERNTAQSYYNTLNEKYRKLLDHT